MDAELRAAVLLVAQDEEMTVLLCGGERAWEWLRAELLTKSIHEVKLEFDLETIEAARIGRHFLSLYLKAKEVPNA